MRWLVFTVLAWTMVAVPLALLLGRWLRRADEAARTAAQGPAPRLPLDQSQQSGHGDGGPRPPAPPATSTVKALGTAPTSRQHR